MSPLTSPAGTRTATDGRSTRWERHRLERRRALVQAALRAIREHGAGVGMEEMAAAAGTSKTVLYRHFGGRTGLYLAIVEHVDHQILEDLRASLHDRGGDLVGLVAATADGYLSLVERDPEIARFVITRPLADEPLQDDPLQTISTRVAEVVAAALRERVGVTDGPGGADDPAFDVWAQALVGMVRGVSDAWLATHPRRPRAAVVADVVGLVRAFHAAPEPLDDPGAAVPATPHADRTRKVRTP